MKYHYAINPVGKPRMTQRDRWKKRDPVLKFYTFRDLVRLLRVQLPTSGANITFYLPMHDSWSKRKKDQMRGQPHQLKPDLDNLIKALCDSVYGEDKVIWQYEARKLWADKGSLDIEYE